MSEEIVEFKVNVDWANSLPDARYVATTIPVVGREIPVDSRAVTDLIYVKAKSAIQAMIDYHLKLIGTSLGEVYSSEEGSPPISIYLYKTDIPVNPDTLHSVSDEENDHAYSPDVTHMVQLTRVGVIADIKPFIERVTTDG